MSSGPRQVTRREAIKWVLTAIASLYTFNKYAGAQSRKSPRIGADPNLLNHGISWNAVLSKKELLTVAALCDVIIPADAKSPSASIVGVPVFINEWVSAPYEQQRGDRKIIRKGLSWIDGEAQNRFRKNFAVLESSRMHEICDDICLVSKAAPKFQAASIFFDLFRDLTMIGFYTTPEGWRDIGYVGNLPRSSFEGPPPEVLRHLGLT